jgi:hypothetical protein
MKTGISRIRRMVRLFGTFMEWPVDTDPPLGGNGQGKEQTDAHYKNDFLLSTMVEVRRAVHL